MTFAWHHPNYYKKLKRKATSSKPQAYQINYDDFCKGDEEEPQASSSKPQASSVKLQAPSSDNPEVTSSPIREPGTKKY